MSTTVVTPAESAITQYTNLKSSKATQVPKDYEITSLKVTPIPKKINNFGEVITNDNLITEPETLRKKYVSQFNIKDIKEKYNVRPFIEATPTDTKDVPTIALESLDFSKYVDGPEGFESRKALADKLEKSISTYGFFNISNFGFDPEKLAYMRSIAQSVLELPQEEKLNNLAGAKQTDLEDRDKSLGGERGVGFKPRGYWSMQQGIRDSIEHYNFRDMLHDDYFFNPNRKYPEVVRAFLPEVAEYFRYLHYNVLKRLCNLCDIILEKPEGFIWQNFYQGYKNDLLNSGAGYGRLMHYLGMNPEEEKITENTWLRGHSDAVGFTFITSQPILSLQIRDYYTGEWKYVGHRPNSLIVNVGDAMEFVTGGYFKSSIHRVVSPPADQKKFKRLVLIYFSCPSLTTVLDPDAVDSPKLKKLGFNTPEDWEKITFAHWDEEKPRLFGGSEVNLKDGDEPTVVKLFGRGHERWHQAESLTIAQNQAKEQRSKEKAAADSEA